MTEGEVDVLRALAVKRRDERRDSGKDSPDPETECCAKLECGGSCFLPPAHDGAHSCVGDFDGERGSCPA